MVIKLVSGSPPDLQYHEAWFDKETKGEIVEHWGILGSEGQVKIHKKKKGVGLERSLRAILSKSIERGFQEVDPWSIPKIRVEYAWEGRKSDFTTKKKNEMKEFIDGLLGWCGMGHLIDLDFEGKILFVECGVIDYKLGETFLLDALKDSPYSEFVRIFRI